LDVKKFATDLRERLSNRHGLNLPVIDVTFEGNSGQVKVDRLLMRHVLMVLVDNAIGAVAAKVDKRIEIRISTKTRNRCSILISDNGKGMPLAKWKEISAGRNPYQDSRSRKGLRTALLIIKGFGGQLNLVKTGRDGSTFEITLPLVK
jgi:C4-dicarboxylate-specific signal transduction histidine kinase